MLGISRLLATDYQQSSMYPGIKLTICTLYSYSRDVWRCKSTDKSRITPSSEHLQASTPCEPSQPGEGSSHAIAQF